jgi:NAD(P)-dependent dehydrogenase (short-subunit alcohol dehydrogenase family)
MAGISFDFSGQAVLITGGASGIGAASARAFQAAGARVTVLDLTAPRGLDAVHVCADVSDPTEVERAFARIEPPAIVVINAGTAVEAALTETSRADWDRVLAVNLTGAFHTLRCAAAAMKPRGAGAIVLTASTNSYDGEANLVAYNASKAGLLGLLHTAANELGPHGIRVNAVCPGLIRTPLSRRQFGDPAFLRGYFQHIPLGRGGEPEEVAAAILFLASQAAAYITGAALLVDGGQSAGKFGTWDERRAEFAGDCWRLR